MHFMILDPEQSLTLPLKHVEQQRTWDCGLACLKMVLR